MQDKLPRVITPYSLYYNIAEQGMTNVKVLFSCQTQRPVVLKANPSVTSWD